MVIQGNKRTQSHPGRNPHASHTEARIEQAWLFRATNGHKATQDVTHTPATQKLYEIIDAVYFSHEHLPVQALG